MVSSGTEERVERPTRHCQGRQPRTSRGKAGNQTAFQMRSERGLHVGHNLTVNAEISVHRCMCPAITVLGKLRQGVRGLRSA